MADCMTVVDYLRLEPEPSLVAQDCSACGARYFARRNACSKCGGQGFAAALAATTGKLRAFTIVYRAAPGVTVPFISAVVDLDGGGTVQANLIGVEPVPEAVVLGMCARLVIFPVGEDAMGTKAIAFGFTPT